MIIKGGEVKEHFVSVELGLHALDVEADLAGFKNALPDSIHCEDGLFGLVMVGDYAVIMRFLSEQLEPFLTQSAAVATIKVAGRGACSV